MAELFESFIALFTPEALVALDQVITIDLVLAGDNAIVIGLAAAGLPDQQRTKAIVIGVAAATLLRVGFAGVTTQLPQIVGLLLAGGILLFWVSWKMWRELHRSAKAERQAADALAGLDAGMNDNGNGKAAAPRKTLKQAAWQIIVADVSMSLDNILAVPVLAGPYEDAYAAYFKGDYTTALRLYRPLADQGHAMAQSNLGLMYRNMQPEVSKSSTESRW